MTATTTDLVLLTESEIDSVQESAAKLAALESSVLNGELDEQLGDAYAWIREVKAIARVRKVADELAARATRAEIVILRRLVQLGYAETIPPSYRSAARGFAELTDDELAGLLSSLSKGRSPVSVWQEWDAPNAAERRRERMLRTSWSPAAQARDRVEEIRGHAMSLVCDLLVEEEQFTTREAADKLASVLGIDRDDTLGYYGVLDLTREAITASAMGDPDEDGWANYVPRVITYPTNEGWVRVPVGKATVEQLAHMAKFRREQVESMEAKCEMIERALRLALSEFTDEDDAWEVPLRDIGILRSRYMGDGAA